MTTMKTVLILSMCLLALSVTKPVRSDNLTSVATALCEYTRANDRAKIRKKLKRAKMKMKMIYAAIQCNGKSLHAFAKDNNADDVVKYFETKIKSSKL